MKGVILAAGKGSRMKELSQKKPKVLLKVDGRSSLEHIISGMKKAGIDEVIIVIGYKGEMIKDELGSGSELGVEITYVEQDLDKYGTGYALSLVEPYIDHSFMLSYGDIILAEDNYLNLYEKYKICNYYHKHEFKYLGKEKENEDTVPHAEPENSKGLKKANSGRRDEAGSQSTKIDKISDLKRRNRVEAVISLNWVEDPSSGGAVYIDDHGFVENLVEKPEPGSSTTNWNSAGLFIFSPLIFEYLEQLKRSERGEYELPSAVNEMLKDNTAIASLKIESYWQDLANPDDYERINELLE